MTTSLAAVSAAETALDTSLAGNAAFVTAITVAGETADADGFDDLNSAVDAATADLAAAEAVQGRLFEPVNTLTHAKDVLTEAAASDNDSIVALSQVLTGDPAAANTTTELEIVNVLVDHEGRITTVESDVAVNTTNIAANTAAITDETAARIAADTAIGQELGALSS